MLLVALLQAVGGAHTQNEQQIEVDYLPEEVVVSVVTGCGLLNIVSANINQVSAQLLTINRLMTKRNWHILLVQETGVISKMDPNPHVSICGSMHNNIFFNSLHFNHLQCKQYHAKMADLTRAHENGDIDLLQFNTQSQLARGRHVYPSGGLAIIINKEIMDRVQVHCTHYISKNRPKHSKHTMAVSLSINDHMTCVINGYSPATGIASVNQWVSKCLHPMVEECQAHKWRVVVGSDFNAAPLPINHSCPDCYKWCDGLLGLLSAEGGLTDSFWTVHPTSVEFSWCRLVKCRRPGIQEGLEALNGSDMDLVMSYL